jgi:hypothetical protein
MFFFVFRLYVVLSRVIIGLYDELITRPKESYHVSHKIKNTRPKNGDQGPAGAVRARADE